MRLTPSHFLNLRSASEREIRLITPPSLRYRLILHGSIASAITSGSALHHSRGERTLPALFFRLTNTVFDKLLHVAHAESNGPAEFHAGERRAPPAGSVISYPAL